MVVISYDHVLWLVVLVSTLTIMALLVYVGWFKHNHNEIQTQGGLLVHGNAVVGGKLQALSVSSQEPISIMSGGTGVTTIEAARAKLNLGTLALQDDIPDTTVIAGSYNVANLTVDAQGRLTAASNGSVGVTSITSGTGIDGGTITSTGTLNLADTSVTAGSYTVANLTVDAQGRLTAASNGSVGVTSITAGTGIDGGTITSTGTLNLADTTVVAASYTAANLTVDAQGRLTAASSNALDVGSDRMAFGPTVTANSAGEIVLHNTTVKDNQLVIKGTDIAGVAGGARHVVYQTSIPVVAPTVNDPGNNTIQLDVADASSNRLPYSYGSDAGGFISCSINSQGSAITTITVPVTYSYALPTGTWPETQGPVVTTTPFKTSTGAKPAALPVVISSSNSGFTVEYDVTGESYTVADKVQFFYSVLATSASVPVGILAVTPNSGTVTGATAENVIWTFRGSGNVELHYSTDSGATYPNVIATGINGSTEIYSWTVPVGLADTTGRVRVRSELYSKVLGASSADFGFIPGTITVTAPIGGESWTQLDTNDITFTCDSGTAVDILYSVNSGGVYDRTITTNLATTVGANTYSWLIPFDAAWPSTTVRVRVQFSALTTSGDNSDADFTIN